MNDKNKTPFKVEDVNWDELSGIGILMENSLIFAPFRPL